MYVFKPRGIHWYRYFTRYIQVTVNVLKMYIKYILDIRCTILRSDRFFLFETWLISNWNVQGKLLCIPRFWVLALFSWLLSAFSKRRPTLKKGSHLCGIHKKEARLLEDGGLDLLLGSELKGRCRGAIGCDKTLTRSLYLEGLFFDHNYTFQHQITYEIFITVIHLVVSYTEP